MEEWVRLTYFLPVTQTNDRTAYLRVLNYLRSRHPHAGTSPPEEPPFTGFTYTADDPPAIHGLYWSEVGSQWVPDNLVLLFIDRKGSLSNPEAILADAERIKSSIAQFYQEEGSPQEAIWCTLESIRLV